MTEKTTLDLRADDVIEIAGVGYMKPGPAIVRSVSKKPSGGGPHYVSTSRGTFLADAEAIHQVLDLDADALATMNERHARGETP